MKNKARLSDVTAFSFVIHQQPFKIYQIILINSFMVIDIMPCITNQNEISKNSLILPFILCVITKQWQLLQKGGIVFHRLLVSV